MLYILLRSYSHTTQLVRSRCYTITFWKTDPNKSICDQWSAGQWTIPCSTRNSTYLIPSLNIVQEMNHVQVVQRGSTRRGETIIEAMGNLISTLSGLWLHYQDNNDAPNHQHTFSFVANLRLSHREKYTNLTKNFLKKR